MFERPFLLRNVLTWSRDLEEGPPKFSDEELAEVEKQSRNTEIESSTEMRVLKPITEAKAKGSDYKCLSTKIVYDWRHRDGRWKKRGR